VHVHLQYGWHIHSSSIFTAALNYHESINLNYITSITYGTFAFVSQHLHLRPFKELQLVYSDGFLREMALLIGQQL